MSPADAVTESARSGGLVLAAGARAEVDAWVAGSVVPVTVVPLEGWIGVITRGQSQVDPPYEDGGLVSACRALSGKAAPGLGFFEVDGRALVTVHAPGRRRRVRWVVWDPERGLLRPPGLELAGPAEIVRIAGSPASSRDELVDLLHETRVRPTRMLQAVMATLGLPGTRLLEEPTRADDLPGAVRLVPDRRQVEWFEDAVRDSVKLRHELGVLP
ncbi:hypothetical protein [Serinicoccus kebangsaanensis]|uniref:hypothetical protein n=1 Tax=Serinicoccus kebangsaanensis TaxID=2602069 RepID=UPI00124E2936|nr:hypothetical protein [Serinicoccus kebangsaanensis]